MGQCQVCSTEADYNAFDSISLLKQLGEQGLGVQIDKLRSDHHDQLSKYKTIRMPDHTFFKGKLVDNKKQGYGQLYSSSFNYYGFFKADQPHGKGAIVTQTHCVLGNFQVGVLGGQAKQWNKKYRFEGKYFRGKRVWGMLYRDELTYTGGWENDIYSGKGKLTFKEGGWYQGGFKEGRFDGKGQQQFHNGNKYKGGYSQGKYQGYGQFIWKNGNVYRGEYKQGKRHGFGVLKVGEYQYAGRWVDGVRQGRGIQTHKGEMGFGEWKDNKIVQTK